jgi:MraZ protein
VVTKGKKVVESGGNDMFIGQYSHSIDEKNRIIIPAKFRNKLGENAVITLGHEGCLAIYTEEEWEKLQIKLISLNTNQREAREHIRVIAGSASECNFDKQGRVILPTNLKNRANIKKELVLVGNIDHIEVWSKESWDSYYEAASAAFDEISAKL